MDTATIGLIVSIVVAIISAVIGPVCVLLVKSYLDKKLKLEDERKKAADDAKNKKEQATAKEEAAWKQEVREFIKPIGIEIGGIKSDIVRLESNIDRLESKVNTIDSILQEDKEATILNMRITMKTLRDKYVDRGYADAGDKASWEELYNRYAHMGGNHFREYVDQWKYDIQHLPSEQKKK